MVTPKLIAHEARVNIERSNFKLGYESGFDQNATFLVGRVSKVYIPSDQLTQNPMFADAPTFVDELLDIDKLEGPDPQTSFLETFAFGTVYEGFFAFCAATWWHPEIILTRDVMLHQQHAIIVDDERASRDAMRDIHGVK